MKQILKLKTGQEYVVVKADGKYYICEDGTHFRKANSDIEEIRKEKEQKEEKNEKTTEEKPKKLTKKESKKGE